jgi:Protein of unknown function (DUF5661)
LTIPLWLGAKGEQLRTVPTQPTAYSRQLAHLNEFSDYYTRLERMEEEATRD